ncbi:hypothetical protein O6H91_02G047700 [Diphasiastrum complanatum]|uniref:Uncharacterized protein n=1 Tax=Diphasiastrum complanatum TaxID=34168 RepID=A0ACC2EF30_DIPCM|nr:hypothetical protein O6H91_02G047700 [Diphasiastrum complanatum]
MALTKSLRTLYLASYNWILFFGWLQTLYLALSALKKTGFTSVYAAVEKPLQVWQTSALLEIFNGLAGIVRSPIIATLPQIGSRIYITWGILWSFPEIRQHWLVTQLVLSWSITEVIRYFFFALKETFGWTPAFLLWLRYSTFFVCYPTGIFGEAGLVYLALPYMKNSDIYSLRMPNKFNFSFDYYYASVVTLLSYIPGSPHMYNYMIGQRKKALGKGKKKSH